MRKTSPKIDTPFKCYIYCTKQKTIADEYCGNRNGHIYIDNGKVIGEFVCDRIEEIPCYVEGGKYDEYLVENKFLQDCCLSYNEIFEYLGGNDGYGWHISNLKIYDKPKGLGEFKQMKSIRGYHKRDEKKLDGINIERLMHGTRIICKVLTRPPQSWCYVEELL